MKKIFPIVIAGWFMAGYPLHVQADDSPTFKTEKGLNFAVPEDWPIEEHGGALAPISVEEYVVRKFKAIEARLTKIESNLSAKTEDSKNSSAIIKSNSSQQQSESSFELTVQLEALARDVAQLKSQAATQTSGGSLKNAEPVRSAEDKEISDRNIAEQIRLIKARLEDVERRLGVVEFHQDN